MSYCPLFSMSLYLVWPASDHKLLEGSTPSSTSRYTRRFCSSWCAVRFGTELTSCILTDALRQRSSARQTVSPRWIPHWVQQDRARHRWQACSLSYSLSTHADVPSCGRGSRWPAACSVSSALRATLCWMVCVWGRCCCFVSRTRIIDAEES